jgi:LacI family transcriptional regulator
VAALVDHAASFGRGRIGFIAEQPGFATTQEWIEGFRSAMAALGLNVAPDYICGSNSTTAEAAQSAHRLLSLQEPPTTIIASNNLTMIGVMRAVCERAKSACSVGSFPAGSR